MLRWHVLMGLGYYPGGFVSTRIQRFHLAARIAESWAERLAVKRPLTPIERRGIANFLKVVMKLLTEQS